jgi:uncharacterized membrane protein YccC
VSAAPSTTIEATAPALRSVWQERWQKIFQFDRGRMEPWVALRNAIGVTLPLAVGVALGMPLGGLAVSTGALQVSYSDGSGPYAQRAKRMLAAGLLCSIAVVAAGLAGRNRFLATILMILWAFAAGLAVSIGPTAESLGVISLVTLIIYAAQVLTPARAFESGLLALGGALLQTGLSVLLWPVHRYQPERRILARLYSELSRAAIIPIGAEGAPPASEQITSAREALSGLGNDNSLEAERYWSLLNQAERIRLSLLTLRRLRKRLARESESDSSLSDRAEKVQRFLVLSSELLAGIGQSLSEGNSSDQQRKKLQELETLAASLRDEQSSAGPASTSAMTSAVTRDIRFQMDALIGQLRSASRTVSETSAAGFGELADRDAVQPWQRRITGKLAILRANLSWQSSAFRHAIRLSLCLAVGEVVAHRLHNDRSYWLAMTIVLVLKQEFAATFARGLLRIGGTIVGLLLATILFHFLAPGVAMKLVLVGIFTFLLRWAGAANYGVFTVAVSALIVVMVAFTGASPIKLIQARAEMTCLGGIIALAAYMAWPTRELSRVGPTLAAMLDAYREYFHAVAQTRLEGERNEAELNRTRLAARLARSNMEASAERLRAEPGVSAEQIALLTAMLANSHRLVRALLALEVVPQDTVPVRPAFRQFVADVETTLQILAGKLRGEKFVARSLPDLREDYHLLVHSTTSEVNRYALVNEEVDRITNSLNTLAEQVRQWEKLQSLKLQT